MAKWVIVVGVVATVFLLWCAFENRQVKLAANANLEKAYDVTLEALGNTLALRDAAAEAHSKRVTAYSIAIARKMGLPTDEIKVIARAAFLHDIGKLATSDEILRKHGGLTAEETVIMRQYVRRGYETINKIPFLVDSAEIVYCHQERFDGSGYPRGLKGDQIPLGARIVAVADIFDLLTSAPQPDQMSVEDARKEIQKGSGHQFDPQIAMVFLSMPDEVWEQLRKDVDVM